MKRCKEINYFLTIALMAVALPAFAVDVTETDPGKTAGGASDQVNKLKQNYDDQMQKISQNQYATAVGDGVKSAKQGMSWAQDQLKDGMAMISDAKDAAFNSTEAKTLMLTQQIASAKKNADSLKNDKKARQAAIDGNLQVEQAAIEEKIRLSRENIQTSISVYQQELQNAQTDEEKERIKEEIQKLQEGGNVEQAELEKELKKLEDKAEAEKKAVSNEYDNQIYAQNEQILELSQQYADLLKKKNTDEGKVEQDPEQVIEESMETFSFKEGEKISLQDRKDKERSRNQRITTNLIETFNITTQTSAETDTAKAQQKTISELGESMTGQSEAIQSAIKSAANQLDSLYNYLQMELKALETATAVLLSESTIAVSDPKSNTDICDYNGKKGGLLGAFESVQGTIGGAVSTAAGAVSATQGAVSNGINTFETATNTVSTATSTATNMVNDGKNTATGLTGMGI